MKSGIMGRPNIKYNPSEIRKIRMAIPIHRAKTFNDTGLRFRYSFIEIPLRIATNNKINPKPNKLVVIVDRERKNPSVPS